ncbi:MAG: hypothetical protein WD469_02495 [Paenibacillaceae bacterium]
MIIKSIINQFNKIREVELINAIQSIQVSRPDSSELMIDNPTDLPLMYQDKKQAIFRINTTLSALFYRKDGVAELQYHCFCSAANRNICPNTFGWGSNYVIIESLNAPTLDQHMEEHSMTEALTLSILQFLKALRDNDFVMDGSPKDIFLLRW